MENSEVEIPEVSLVEELVDVGRDVSLSVMKVVDEKDSDDTDEDTEAPVSDEVLAGEVVESDEVVLVSVVEVTRSDREELLVLVEGSEDAEEDDSETVAELLDVLGWLDVVDSEVLEVIVPVRPVVEVESLEAFDCDAVVVSDAVEEADVLRPDVETGLGGSARGSRGANFARAAKLVVETEKLRVEELLDSTEDNDSEAEKSENVNVLELSEEPVDVDDSPELGIKPLEDVGVADVTPDTVALEDLEKTAPSRGSPLKDVANSEADGSVEVDVEAPSDTASNELESVNESEKLDELDDADEPKVLRVSAEDETLNEPDEPLEDIGVADRLEEPDDAEEDEELEDSSTLAKDCCATMIVPGRLPDGGMVEIGSGVVRTSVPEYGTVDVTKRPSRAKTIVPGAVPLGCIVVMGIVPVILLVPE
ncbi:hypothetical protein LX32DRAFT_666150 [Colletotrichum zoysiae]|uniref:Uncharacterized protein n=1 Tax=Colletotrichum zoysiae TaxID=1216348 RepID=A0AAD9HB82_9PEZI|nr:hypothetical protein LX32DRAFT_666150 [Colletotrichum zoysiae]